MKVFFIVLFVLPIIAFAGSVNVLSSFYSPDWFPNGLAWDGNYLWLLGAHYDTFYQLSSDGSVVSYFTPAEPGGLNGDGAAFDGTNLWVSDQESDIIYEVELSGVGLQRYTFGRIKTLF